MNITQIPVVLIHKGASARYPLDLVAAHDARYGNDVHLISDAAGARWPLDDYWGGAGALAQYYQHLSGNHVEFERFCLQRWAVLRDWMRARRVERCLYTDSDVLLYCDAAAEWPRWGEGYALTLALGSSGATSYWTLAGLEAFCDFVLSVYALRNQYFQEFERIYREMQAQGLPGGISDMALLKWFKQEVKHVKVGEMSDIRDGATWDHSINSPLGLFDGELPAEVFAMKGGRKDVVFRDGLPYVECRDFYLQKLYDVRHLALHFQGQAKSLIAQFARTS